MRNPFVSEPTVRVGVTVTFLRMDKAPADPAPALPDDATVVRVSRPTVAFYRYLYDTVGGAYLWWLRRTVPERDMAALLAAPDISIHVLYRGGEPAGFYELDRRNWPTVNLAYFGLMPHAVGGGLGRAFLRHAVDAVWAMGATGMTVNTCTADHKRALPTYRAIGFRPVREVREMWDVPRRLGMVVPAHLPVR